MNGDYYHLTGKTEFCLAADSFDLYCDCFCLCRDFELDDGYLSVERNFLNNSWHTAFTKEKDDRFFCQTEATDLVYPDLQIIHRSLRTRVDIAFKIKFFGSEYAYHEKYVIGRDRVRTLEIIQNDRIFYIIFTGDCIYDQNSQRLCLFPGSSEIIMCGASTPATLIRGVNKVLTQKAKAEPIDIARSEIANALDTLLCYIDPLGNVEPCHHPLIPQFIFEYSARVLLGNRIKVNMPKFSPKDIIHGMLPVDDGFEGSAINTLLYIMSDAEYSSAAKNMFRENFVRGDMTVLNSIKRKENCRLPRFSHGKCDYCHRHCSKLEKTVCGNYACIKCFDKADSTAVIPTTAEQLSPLPFLIKIYLGIELSLFENEKALLESMAEMNNDTLTLSLLLYALCKFKSDKRHKVYLQLTERRNNLGIWHGITPCCAVTNAIASVAVTEYNKN